MSVRYDAGLFAGNWPFHRLRDGALDRVLALHREAGLTGGLVSSLDAIFFDDPAEADAPLARALEGTDYGLALTVNPELPTAETLLRSAQARAARLYPGIHGYDPAGEPVRRLIPIIEERGWPVILTARLEDERLETLLRQKPVDLTRCVRLARQFPKTRFLLSAFRLQELLEAAGAGLPDNVWVDTAGLQSSLFPMEKLLEAMPAERVLFASYAPLQSLRSALLNLEEPALTPPMREWLLTESFWGFMGGQNS